MYADDNKSTNKSNTASKTASFNIPDVIARYVDKLPLSNISLVNTGISKTDKTADSKQERVDIPHSSKPVYAGEEREKGEISGAIPTGKNIGGSCAEKPKNAINELLTKLAVVLAPNIEQTMENLEAEREGRVPRRIPRNRGVKKYPCAGVNIMPPMQIAQNQPQNAQTQQNNQYPSRPVGGGSHPQFNPINSFGALSTSGVINGNAAFGARNSPDSNKIAGIIKRATRSEVLEKLMAMGTVTPEAVRYYDEEYEEELGNKKRAQVDELIHDDPEETPKKQPSVLKPLLLGAAGGLGGFAIGQMLDPYTRKLLAGLKAKLQQPAN